MQKRSFRVVVDYAYSRISGVLPQMLGQLETETIALNAYTDAKRAPKTLRRPRGAACETLCEHRRDAESRPGRLALATTASG